MNNGKICVSVCAETAAEMIANIKRAEENADVVELRLDCLRPEQLEICLFEISNLKFEIPLIATYRSPEQGGHSTATVGERKQFWQTERSGFWAGDVEEDVLKAPNECSTWIVSFHDFEGLLAGLTGIFDRLYSSKADIVKIAVRADDATDALPVWKLIEFAQNRGKEFIPIAMGDAGKWTRILGLAHGAYLTYASLDASAATAPGQVTARELTGVFRVKDLDRNTRVFGIIGDPVSSSFSPYIHNPAFVDAGINAVFIPFLVKDLDGFMRRMVKPESREVELNFGGFSVTMPHKQSIMKHLDAIDPTAEKIGAVNTVQIDVDGKLTGYNTDAHGFIKPLKAAYGDLSGAKVGLFGAGGAARACVYALNQENADITVYGRDEEKLRQFGKEFGVNAANIATAEPRDFDIIVDATPFGMKGPLEHESIFTSERLKGVRFVYDLVTKSVDTPLIKEAKKAGIPTLGGLEMLVAQGARQFEIWTGRQADPAKLRESVLVRMSEI